MTETNTLQSLYPFLHGRKQDDRALEAGLTESLRQKATHSVEVKRRFFEENAAEVVAVARAIAAVYRKRGRLFTMGNGGSSCDAAHIAVEFQHPVTAGRPALPAKNLTADAAVMTACRGWRPIGWPSRRAWQSAAPRAARCWPPSTGRTTSPRTR